MLQHMLLLYPCRPRRPVLVATTLTQMKRIISRPHRARRRKLRCPVPRRKRIQRLNTRITGHNTGNSSRMICPNQTQVSYFYFDVQIILLRAKLQILIDIYLLSDGRLLWDFLQQLLNDPTQRYTNYIAWKNRDTGVFKIVDPAGLAKLWGIQKNHLSMNYDKMSRALRYYYRVNILRKVQGERHCYQ